jgi:putative glutamine amidotransferase
VADDDDAADPGELLERVDGVILSGGSSDVSPRCYGADRHPETADDEPGRDSFEMALARGGRDADIPVLGICRGMQLLNVAYGGTLHQHLPALLGDDDHRALPAGFSSHEVQTEPGSLAERATGNRVEEVLSHHHQGVDEVGRGLRVTARASADELIEAIEDPAARFLLGVQWHPEEDERSRVVSALVEAAERR